MYIGIGQKFGLRIRIYCALETGFYGRDVLMHLDVKIFNLWYYLHSLSDILLFLFSHDVL